MAWVDNEPGQVGTLQFIVPGMMYQWHNCYFSVRQYHHHPNSPVEQELTFKCTYVEEEPDLVDMLEVLNYADQLEQQGNPMGGKIRSVLTARIEK